MLSSVVHRSFFSSSSFCCMCVSPSAFVESGEVRVQASSAEWGRTNKAPTTQSATMWCELIDWAIVRLVVVKYLKVNIVPFAVALDFCVSVGICCIVSKDVFMKFHCLFYPTRKNKWNYEQEAKLTLYTWQSQNVKFYHFLYSLKASRTKIVIPGPDNRNKRKWFTLLVPTSTRCIMGIQIRPEVRLLA